MRYALGGAVDTGSEMGSFEELEGTVGTEEAREDHLVI